MKKLMHKLNYQKLKKNFFSEILLKLLIKFDDLINMINNYKIEIKSHTFYCSIPIAGTIYAMIQDIPDFYLTINVQSNIIQFQMNSYKSQSYEINYQDYNQAENEQIQQIIRKYVDR